MNEPIYCFIAIAMGCLLGIIFYGGLWLTTKRLLTSKMPALLAPVSFFARTAVVLAGFYMVGPGQPVRIMFCLLGFILIRVVFTKTTATAKQAFFKTLKHTKL